GGRARAAETTVRPGDVDLAGPVDGGAGKGWGAQVTGVEVVVDRRDRGWSRVFDAAVGGDKRLDSRARGIVGRHHHRAVGLYDGLAADHACRRDRRLRPGHPAVPRIGHVQLAAVASAVALRLAPAVVGAAGPD